jgi:hypothetical protein
VSRGTWAAAADRALKQAFDALPAGADAAAIEKAIHDAYPFGPRSHHPYKVWLARVKVWKQMRAKLRSWQGTQTEITL